MERGVKLGTTLYSVLEGFCFTSKFNRNSNMSFSRSLSLYLSSCIFGNDGGVSCLKIS